MSAHECNCQPGMFLAGPIVTEHRNDYAQHWFEAVSEIKSLFGSEVDGRIKGIGATAKIALQRLESEREKLYGSLWV